jgi:hypothetical protein
MQMKEVATPVQFFLFTFAACYFGAAPLVGWRFLLPGRYTFGVLACLGLVLAGAALVRIAPRFKLSQFLVAATAFLAAASSCAAILGRDPAVAKDILIVGLAPALTSSIVVYRLSATSARAFFGAAWTTGVSRGALVAVSVFVLASIVSFGGFADVARLLRLQAYSLFFAVVFGAILVFAQRTQK